VNTARLSLVALVAGAVAFGGCGSDNSSNGGGSANTSTGGGSAKSGGTGGGASGGSVKLSEAEFKIKPADPTVSKTGTVTFAVSNDGQTTHALEVEGPNGESKTSPIAPGQSANLKVDLSKAGSYEMYCPIDNHKAMGMKGEIKVAGGGSGGSSSKSGKSGGSGSGGNGY
jgi:uncharacterized cupredoxin-like copper-binding protein